jgi:YesN/AraC family two-component response regulator
MARVLIVDDEPIVLQMLQRFLEHNEFDVQAAADGTAALEMHRKTPADLVITDILMPGKEGFETIRDFRKTAPGIKIIAISGGGKNEPHKYLRFATTFGADRAFAKPLDLGQLLSAIQELLGLVSPDPFTAKSSPTLGASGV